MSNFVNCLKLGNKFQDEFIKIKNWKPNTYKIMTGKFLPYDIIHYGSKKEVKYEIKCDRLAYKTGNLCIEFQCNEKPSGISTSESDYYVYFVLHQNMKDYDYYKIRTSLIKDLINEKKYHKIINGGDGWRAKSYLFKIDLFDEYKKN